MSRTDALTLFLAGANLSLVQWLAIRELGPLIGSSELVVLLVVTAYFLGMSVGYLVADELSPRALRGLAAGTVAFHLSLPFSLRWLAGAFHAIGLAGNVPPLIFLAVLCGVSPFYALVLPRIAQDLRDRAGTPVTSACAVELAGSLAALVALVTISPARVQAIAVLHLAGLVGLAALMGARRLAAVAAPLIAVYALAYAPLHEASLVWFYRHAFGMREPRLLASELSAYSRVDIVADRSATPKLYLDGVRYYGDAGLNRHNLLVSILPNLARATPPVSVVIGGGSLDAARYLSGRTAKLTVVEIDEAVPRLTRAHIQEPRGGFPTGWELVVDDGMHHLATLPPASIDVLSVDVPVPISIQTARFHAPRFFELARERLKPDGVLSISLSGGLRPGEPGLLTAKLANRIVAGLKSRFAHVKVLATRSGEQAFAWASASPIAIDQAHLSSVADKFFEDSKSRDQWQLEPLRVVPDAEVDLLSAGFAPLDEADMQTVMTLSLIKLVNRHYRPRR